MNRKSKEKNIRKLTKMGKTSLGLSLPIDLVAGLGWREKQRVVVTRKGSKLIVSDWKKKKHISKL
jgi:hypothetical protein